MVTAMNKAGIFIIGLVCATVFFWGCDSEELETLAFFEVQIEDPTTLSLGRIALHARVSGLAGASVEEAGFLVSEDANDVINLLEGAIRLQTAPPDGNEAFTIDYALAQEQTIYIRAFARLGERTVYSEEIRAYGLGNVVVLAGAAQVWNNQMTLRAQLLGLEDMGLSVLQHGHVYAPLGIDPLLGAPQTNHTELGAANDDKLFESNVIGLSFNTIYTSKAYVITSSGVVFYSDSRQDTIKGGWEQIADFPTPYHRATACPTADQTQAIAGFGLDELLITNAAAYPRACWQYQPHADSWTSVADYSQGLPHVNATSFGIGDTLYFLFGEYYDPAKTYTRELHKYAIPGGTWSRTQTPVNMRRLTGAIAFALNDKGYVGTGEYYDPTSMTPQTSNECWQYDPGTGQWTHVAGLPLRAPGIAGTRYEGRQEAAAFALAGKGYVVGGVNGALYLKDCWAFTPPSSPQDTGSWAFVGYFPGGNRIEAVAFAALGKGYVGLGTNVNRNFDDLWEFNPATGLWASQNPFPGGRRRNAMAFALNDIGYVGAGIGRTELDEEIFEDQLFSTFWRFVPSQY